MNRKGFTLIELLVVISIISLLVSILLPSLGKARELAERSACMSTLGGIGKAWVMYMDSNDDSIPMLSDAGNILTPEPEPSATRPEDAHTVMKAMSDYVAENGWQCPSKTGKKYFNKYDTSYTYYQPYLYALAFGGDSTEKVARLKKIGDQFSSSMPVFGDMYDASESGFGSSHKGKKKNDEASVVVSWDSHVEFLDANVMDNLAENPDIASILAALATP